MPRLNERKEPRIATYLNLSQRCRDDLESAIGQLDGIKTLTDAVEEAAKLLAARVKRAAKPKPPQDPS